MNHRSAPLEVRERFSIPEERRRSALIELRRAEAIEEILLVSTSERTEFVLWTDDASAASGAILNFLTRDYGLKLCEWKFFYRKLDQAALAHILLETAGLDSLVMRQHECCENLKDASVTALSAGTLGRFLDTVVQTAFAKSAALQVGANRGGIEEAEKSALREAKVSYSKLLAERLVPTIVALRCRLDEICLRELESFYAGLSSLSSEEREKIEEFASRLTQRIAGTLAHELKEPCEKTEQERLALAVQRLFHLETVRQTASAPK